MTSKGRKKTSRRGFLQGVAISTAAVGGAELVKKEVADAASVEQEQAIPLQSTEFDFTQKSAALQPDKIVNSACQFCNSLCRLKVHLKNGRIIDVLGEPNDPVQAGGFCIKGPMMTQLVYNRFRLKSPMKRVGGDKGDSNSQFEPISWNEALSIIASKFLALRDAGEARAIANKTSGRLPRGTGSLVERYFSLLGSPNNTDVGPVCNDAGGNALAWTFGLGNFTNGYGIDDATKKEDLGSAKLFLFLGTNQAETHPVTFAYLLRSRAKTKAKLVVIDPRLTPTGAQADEWIAPKPHTDLALVLAMLYHIVTNNLYDAAFVKRWVLGFDELKKHLISFSYTPEWASIVTDVPASKIRLLAEAYAKTKPAAIFCNAGISHQLGAFDTYRCLTFLAAITGNIGINGGGCNFMHNTWPGSLNLPAIIGKTPNKDIALPVGPDYFAQSIISGKPYQLKAIVTQGNPLLACSDTVKVQQAYRQLEFYVYTGLFMEESAYYADIILPVTSGFEMETVYMRRDDRAIRWQEQVVAPVGESKPDWHIWIDLAHATAKLDKRNPPEYWRDNFPSSWKDYGNLWATFLRNTPGMGGMTQQRLSQRKEPLRWPCPTVNHPGVSTLYLDHPSWYEAAEALNPNNIGKRFLTPSGKVEIYTPQLQTRLAEAGHSALPSFYTHPEVTGKHPTIEYASELVKNPVNPQALTQKVKLGKISSGEVHKQYPLMGMTGRPSVVHFHSVTHWTYTGKQMNGVRLVQIHPKTAQTAGIENGDEIIVESPRGAIKGTALLWQGIREDTIFVPNWFGSQQKMAEDLATPYYEAANVLIDQNYYDNLSGQQAFKCFACRLKKVT
ncbi:MAG: molybdopterin-dependent oxidoreductase [Nostoc sp. DedQUE04]|uniref:molybdopterin-containing oxidoreductase family protein n=1 Tax=unclassified Nostoc TaxID=2593658 RepID=UPI002AD343E7|nr:MULTISPECIES: molybdopterin-dependent oxidoreductase [unclassified Nostoc]MDZ8131190.1 molybdopterin-dependent oxidoreductase [Nostoc sp. DedQUE07]MDZ8134805.1 molybdopterin-dependent oxidoreductase [Nostoc sp. DedQUE04]